MNAPRTILLLLLLATTGSLAHAQQAVSLAKDHQLKHEKRTKAQATDGYVFMKGGVMLAMQSGSVVSMTAPITMSDGTKVLPDGTVTQPDGKQLMLHNGQYLLPEGRILDESQLKGKRKE
ncbi:MAG: DUF6799 domain-containing protein [Janthinobacterium lividum]